MQYELEQAVSILSRTPAVLDAWLRGLPQDWAYGHEGPETWSPYDVVGHLIHGEETDWIPRAKQVLEHGESQAFTPFDRFAQFETSRGKTMDDLLDEFASLRARNLAELEELGITDSDFSKTGLHPEFGTVTLRQLLATWVVHDQSHIGQIARVMSRQYAPEVGPWKEYLPILRPRNKA